MSDAVAATVGVGDKVKTAGRAGLDAGKAIAGAAKNGITQGYTTGNTFLKNAYESGGGSVGGAIKNIAKNHPLGAIAAGATVVVGSVYACNKVMGSHERRALEAQQQRGIQR